IRHVAAQNTTLPAASNSTAALPSTAPADCHCGFVDPTTSAVYTDSVIVYFNETSSIPADIFSVTAFAHPYEKGWDLFYREGAKAENVYFTAGDVWNLSPGWLSLNVSGYTPEHLVSGSGLQTVRQDIQYGTFRVFMRSPAPWAGGSALTMRLQYNETSSAELDLMNMDDSTDNACMQTTVSNQDPLTTWGTNYTDLQNATYGASPWDFWEYRMDWSQEEIGWYVASNVSTYLNTRTVPASNASLVDMPTAFDLKHWSNGDPDFMQGPPQNDASAAIGWVRLFFNSSVQSTSQAGSASCNSTQLCSVDDMSLRLSTAYTPASTVHWLPTKEAKASRSTTVGIVICIASLAFSGALVLHALLRKWTDQRQAKRYGVPVGSQRPKVLTSPLPSTDNLRSISQAWTTDYELRDLKPGTAASSSTMLGGDFESSPAYQARHGRFQRTHTSERPLLGHYDSTAASSVTAFISGMTPGAGPTPLLASGWGDQRSSYFGGQATQQNGMESIEMAPPRRADTSTTLVGNATPAEASTTDLLSRATATTPAPVSEVFAAAANPGAKPAPPAAGALPVARTRVDYLAGLVAVCSLLVSATHFTLTFVPSVVMEYLPNHYRSEYWARRTIEPFFFNEIWVGLFLTTSTRFLTSGYLRTGSLKTIAEKVVCRCPRLMIPITAVILLEYFLMDLGATTYLEYIPSITWSTWPSTSVYPNFGWFFNETLQILYLIPNAAPQITWNYCMGVLWTIPVQLQFSWVSLLGAVVVREIKTPWKRFGYYAFCMVNSWYAMNWGYYFYGGLLLADLDITFKYRKYIQARAWLHYPLLNLAILLVLLSLANDLVSIWTGFTFSTAERSLHPDIITGLNLGQTARAGYPEYTEPKLNGMVFAVGSQYIVELSPWLQSVLSTKIFLWLFPHVFTIYLIHGLVFWSLGSLACVYFAGLGYPYWLNMLLTALISYAGLFAILPLVTPVMEMLGKEITRGIWVSASEAPAEWRPSSHPFAVEEIRAMVYRKDDDPGAGGGKGKGRAGRHTRLSSGEDGREARQRQGLGA
ncbi:hypothetical protein LTR53_014008, partial [Teratosphaeriaceae sp. CCFEE 6253]